MAEAAAAWIFKFVATNLVRAGVSKAFLTSIANVARLAIQASLIMGANYAANAIVAPKPNVPDSRLPMRQSTPTRKSAFGRNRGSGAYLNYAVDGGDSIDVLAIHDGRIAGIDSYLLHDDYVSLETGRLGAGHVIGDPSTHQYYEAIYIDTRLGTATQTAFQRSAGRLPDSVWSSSHLLTGVAALELLCLGPKRERLPKVYPLGLPRPSVVYRAQYCHDWRDEAQDREDWTTWTGGSRNPILQLATFLINPRDPDPGEPDRCLGLGEDWDTIIAPFLDQWTQAADDCDAAIAKKGGGTEPAYQCDFEYFVGEDPADTIARMLASCDGWLGVSGTGGLIPYVGKYRAPTVTILNDWIVDHDIISGVAAEKRKNVIVPFWTDPNQKFTRVEGERWFDSANISLTGRQEVQPAELVQVQSHGQVRRIIKRLAMRMTAPRRGTLVCDLRALDALGERWVQLEDDFEVVALRGAILELDDIKTDLVNDRVEIPFIQFDPDIDDWDPESEEGTAPPSPSEVGVQPVPVIDAGDIAISVTTESVFGGARSAVATLVFDAPVNTFDLGVGGMVDEPRVELGWVVRWRPSSGGEWVEETYGGDVLTGNQEDGYVVTLKTPGLPREEIHVQLAAIGGNGGRGAFSDSVTVDVAAATAPALGAATGVTAVASMETGDAGARRPVLTVGFDAITDPQAQLVIIALKAVGASEATYAQIDAVEPRLGGKVVWNVPLGETVDVGVQVWAQWREPSAWTTVSSVAIPGEIGASTIGGEDADAVLLALEVAEQDILDNIEDIGAAFDDIGTLTDGLAQEIIAREAAVDAERLQTTREIGELSQSIGAEVAALFALAHSESARRLSEDARVEELVISVGARLDGDEFYSASSVDQYFLAIADFDSTIGLYDLTVHSDFAALVGDLDDLSDDVAALGITVDDLPNVYLSQSDASSTYATQNSQTTALASLQDAVEAQIDIVEGDLDDLGDVVDTINAQVSSTSTALATLTRSFGEATQNIAAQIAGALAAIAVGSAAVADVQSAAFAHTENYRAEFTAQLDETVDGTLAHSIADIASYAVGQTDIDSSFAAWGLAVGSEYNVTTRFGNAESDISDLVDDVSALDGELGTLTTSVANIVSDYITSTDQASAFAGFGMTIGSEYNVTTRFGDVETDISDLIADVSTLDGELGTLTTSVANIVSDYITSTDQASAFAQFGLTLGAGFNIDTRFDDAEADIDTLTGDLVDANSAIDINAVAIAAADRAVAEMSQSIGAWLAGALASSESSTQAAVTQGEAVLQRLETLRVTLEADYLNSSAIEEAYLLQADFDSTLAAYTFAVNSVTRTIADHLNHVEDGVDALGLDLDTNYYTIAEADAEFMTSTEVASAIASYDLSVHASITPITGDIDDILDDIDGVAGVSTGLNAIASLMLDAFVDNSDPDNPLLLARVQLEAAAGGGNPAFLSLLDGAGLNSAVLAADVVVLANLGVGENEIQEALRAVAGNIEIVNDLLLGAAGSLRQYDDSDVLRLLFGEDDSGDRGIFAYDANGDDLLIIDIDNEIYELSSKMLPVGSVIDESSGELAATSIYASTCSSGQCAPTSSSDFNTLTATTGVVNGAPGDKVEVTVYAVFQAHADVFRWQYFKHYIHRLQSTGTATVSVDGTEYGELAASESTGAVSAQMVTNNRKKPITVVRFSTDVTLPGTGETYYDADGYRFRWTWNADNSMLTACQEGTNRNSGARDCTVEAYIKVEVIKA